MITVCITGACPISYSTVLDGQQVSYAWPTSGTWSVQVTATDSLQRTGTYSFTVDVRDVGPQLVLSPNCPNGSSANCDKHSVDLGTATGLRPAS